MVNVVDKSQDVVLYLDRVEVLYRDVEAWVRNRHPSTKFSRTAVELDEELTGPYKAESFEVSISGKSGVRLIPRGVFMVGARGRVDARSPLGSEILVWVEKGGPHLHVGTKDGGKILEEVTRSLYPEVEEGWAWGDEQRLSLLHLTEEVFWSRVMSSLSE